DVCSERTASRRTIRERTPFPSRRFPRNSVGNGRAAATPQRGCSDGGQRGRLRPVRPTTQGVPMAFELPPLPYAKDALAPHMSEQTLNYHHGNHHQTHAKNLFGLVEGPEHEGKSLEELMLAAAPGGLVHDAAQLWHPTSFWSCMTPGGGG